MLTQLLKGCNPINYNGNTDNLMIIAHDYTDLIRRAGSLPMTREEYISFPAILAGLREGRSEAFTAELITVSDD